MTETQQALVTRKKVAPDDSVGGAQPENSEYRIRQNCCASLLESIFGPFGQTQPELWDQRTYLLLVAMVYEYLSTHKGVPTKDLVLLAKTLSTARPIAARKGLAVKDHGITISADRFKALPEHVRNVIQQIYGVNVAERKSNTESE